MFACKSVCQRKSTGSKKTCLAFSPLTLFFCPGMIAWKGCRVLRSPLPQNPAQLPYNQTEVQQKCCQTTLQSFGLLGKEQRKTCEEQSLQQWQEQKRDKTVIINLRVALLKVCRVFFYSNANCWFYLHYLNFFYTSCYVLFYKDTYEAPSSISSGTVFLYFPYAVADCHGNNSRSNWKTFFFLKITFSWVLSYFYF